MNTEVNRPNLPIVDIDIGTQDLIERLSQPTLPERGSGLVFVTSKSGELKGVVSDSDIRRYLEANNQLPEKIVDLMRTDVISLESSDWESKAFFKLAQKFDERGWNSFLPVRFLPITRAGKLINVIDLDFYRSEISDLRNVEVVIGLGYVGLTLALKLASQKRRVIGVEANHEIIMNLNRGNSNVQEPGIEGLLANLVGVNLEFISNLRELKRPRGITFNFYLCVGTPRIENSESLDLDIIWKVVRDLAEKIQPGDALIQRSTVPVGTGTSICNVLRDEFNLIVGHEFHYVAAPERTVEGDAINELSSLPQLLAGATKSCLMRGEHIFRGFVKTIVPFSSVEVCELAKVATNSYRDYTFAFSNYLASICRGLKIDVNEIIAGVNFGYDRAKIPDPSPGVGGPCLSKDPYLLNHVPSQFDLKVSPVVVARKFNEAAVLEICDFLNESIPDLNSKEVLFIGLAFKGRPEVKDLRNSTAVEISQIVSTICKNSFAIDAVADLNSIKFSHPLTFPKLASDQVSVFMVLNNHFQNKNILNFYLSGTKAKHIWIFDPWRVIDTNSLSLSEKTTVTLINLSNITDFQSGGDNG